MSALVILIPVSLILLGIAVGAFFWAVNKGQFDDLDTPPLRILEDDPPPPVENRHLKSECPDNTGPVPQPLPRGERNSSVSPPAC